MSLASRCPSIAGGGPKRSRCTPGGIPQTALRNRCSIGGGSRGRFATPAGYGFRGSFVVHRTTKEPRNFLYEGHTSAGDGGSRLDAMEATAQAAASVDGHAPGPIRGLPPGPRMGRVLQTAVWSRRAQWLLEQSRARFGPMFTLRIAYEGEWVMVTDPELVKQVFTGDPRVFHAGEGNQILRPVLGDNSVLVLDEKKHITQRKLLLPPFHGERMQAYGEKMSEIAAREIESWPTGVPYKLRPRMQAITLEIIIETVFGVHDTERMG